MRRRHSLSQPEEPVELNLIPLIDIIMFLLIFFVSTTSFMEEKGVKVDKPASGATSNSEESTTIIFTVTADGKITFDGKEVGLQGVRPTVKRLCSSEPLPVVVQSHENARSGVMVRILDEAMLGGAKDVSVASSRG